MGFNPAVCTEPMALPPINLTLHDQTLHCHTLLYFISGFGYFGKKIN